MPMWQNRSQFCTQCYKPPRWLSGRAFASCAGDRGLIPGRDRPKSLKQVVTAPLPNARQQATSTNAWIQLWFGGNPVVQNCLKLQIYDKILIHICYFFFN